MPNRSCPRNRVLRAILPPANLCRAGCGARVSAAPWGEQVLAHGADHLQLQLLVEHLVIQPAGDDHVGARRFVGPVRPYEIGQITFRQAEQFYERRLRACRERLPGLDEGFVCVFAGQFERITYGVVPQGVHLYLVTVARVTGRPSITAFIHVIGMSSAAAHTSPLSCSATRPPTPRR